MAVYKSLRKEAAVAFIAETAKLRVDTLRILKKFPTSYRYLITNNMMTMINDAYTNILKGNSLFISDAMLEDDFKLRHRYITIAKCDVEALRGEISFLYDMMDSGENCLGTQAERNKKFQNWSDQTTKVIKNSNNNWVYIPINKKENLVA